jgi:hypothetical protein
MTCPLHCLIVPLLAAVGSMGCADQVVRVPVSAPRVRAAADELWLAKTARVQSEDGSAHEVNADWRLTYRDRALSVMGTWTLREVAAACAPGSLAQCPTDPVFISRLNGNGDLLGGPWLEPGQRVASPNWSFVVGGLAGVGILGGFATAEVTCFTSWCGDGGKTAFVATDVALALGAVGLAVFWVAVARGMNH